MIFSLIETHQNALADIGNLAGIYGLFFVVQAFAYSIGARLEEFDGTKVIKAVLHGIKHLSHILLPTASRAWPLGPVLCGILLLYSIYLPSQLRQAAAIETAALVNRYFFSLVFAVSITTVLSFVFHDRLLSCIANSPKYFKFGRWLIYLLMVVICTSIGQKFSSARFNFLYHEQWLKQPWPEIVTALTIAWLLLLSFLGSHFDGALDRKLGVLNR